MSLLYFILSGILLYLLLKFGALFVRALAGRRPIVRFVSEWFPVIETGAWVLFVFWGAYLLFGGISFYNQLLFFMAVFLLIGISWYFFRDIFAGTVLKSECRLHEGQHIKTPFVEGLIVQLGLRYLELENNKGERVKIPYSSLSNHWINLPAQTDNTLSNHFKVRVPESVDPLKVKDEVHRGMMGMPWIVGMPPKIKLLKGQEDHVFLDIHYSLLKEEHALLVEKKVSEMIQSFIPK